MLNNNYARTYCGGYRMLGKLIKINTKRAELAWAFGSVIMTAGLCALSCGHMHATESVSC